MMIALDLISKQRTQTYSIFKGLFILSLLVLISSIFYFQFGNVVDVILIAILFTSGVSIGYVKQHIGIGQILFSDTEVIVERDEKNVFEVQELQKISLTLHSYKNEESIATIFGISGGLTGLGNYVEFIDANSIKHRYDFFINTVDQKRKLQEFRKIWIGL